MSACIDHGKSGDKNGYAKTRMPKLFGRKTLRLHRVVFFKHHGFWPEVVMHTCDNPRCINPEHLVAGTNALNVQDRVNKGRSNHFIAHPGRKLSRNQVLEVRSSSETLTTLATQLGVTTTTISRIRRGLIYTDINV